jgi:hypothetical protein
MTVNLGDVIAMRIYKLGTNSNEELVVQIGKPTHFPDSDDFYVPYRITGAGDEATRYIGGIDSVQCLQLVMHIIGAELFRLSELLGQSIRWSGGDNGEIGFPL